MAGAIYNAKERDSGTVNIDDTVEALRSYYEKARIEYADAVVVEFKDETTGTSGPSDDGQQNTDDLSGKRSGKEPIYHQASVEDAEDE
jgi:hypothetical protein